MPDYFPHIIHEDERRNNNAPWYFKKFSSQIYSVQLSPYEWSHDILCIVFMDKITIAQIKLQETGLEIVVIEEFEFKEHERCYHVALSPQTSLSVLPKILEFCATGDDFKIRFYQSNVGSNSKCQTLSGHTDYINDINFENETCCLASVSDDQTARIWDLSKSEAICVFYLTAPGIAVCWHKEDNVKLMVCEKSGLVRFYNVQSQQPILSLEHNFVVSSAHWCPFDCQIVGTIEAGNLILWDLTRPSRPAHIKPMHVSEGSIMQFSYSGSLVATVNARSNTIKVTQLQNGQTKLEVRSLLPTNCSWHCSYPLFCVGDDNKLCFWKIDPN